MMKSRRELLIATGALALYAQQTKHTAGKPAPLRSSKKIRLGIAGGGFGSGFSFHEHPNCEVTAVTDLKRAAGVNFERRIDPGWSGKLTFEAPARLVSTTWPSDDVSASSRGGEIDVVLARSLLAYRYCSRDDTLCEAKYDNISGRNQLALPRVEFGGVPDLRSRCAPLV